MPKRETLFHVGLRAALAQDRRPQVIYGTKERDEKRPPIFLPPMMNNMFLKCEYRRAVARAWVPASPPTRAPCVKACDWACAHACTGSSQDPLAHSAASAAASRRRRAA